MANRLDQLNIYRIRYLDQLKKVNVIRSTNNGVSAFVNPKGQIIEQISEKGYVDVNKIKRVNKTYFAKHSNKIFFYFVLIYTTFIVILKIREN